MFAGAWTVDIEKMWQNEYWTNRYVVNAANLVDATNVGTALVTRERTFHELAVLFTRVRIADTIVDSDVYQILNINAFGQRNSGSVNFMPLFNVMRVDLNVSGGGRPSRKYYRLPLVEELVHQGQFTAAFMADFAPLVAPLATIAGFVDVDNQDIIDAAIYPFVGMRQLRRGSKRQAPAAGTPV